jgi:homogentisate 1,2-dioxygenase
MSNHYPSRRFVIFNVSELSTIDFSQVYETSADTVRKSVDELETFVKFDSPTPSSVTSLTTKSQEYDYDEILVILATPEWTDPNPPI